MILRNIVLTQLVENRCKLHYDSIVHEKKNNFGGGGHELL